MRDALLRADGRLARRRRAPPGRLRPHDRPGHPDRPVRRPDPGRAVKPGPPRRADPAPAPPEGGPEAILAETRARLAARRAADRVPGLGVLPRGPRPRPGGHCEDVPRRRCPATAACTSTTACSAGRPSCSTASASLDIGCGSGGAARAAARIVGPEGMVRRHRPRAPSASPTRAAAHRRRRCRSLYRRRRRRRRLGAVPDRTFDCVVASMMLEQVGRPARRCWREVFRVLRPGGRFVASVTAFDRLRPIDAALMGIGDRRRRPCAPAGALAGRASRASIPHEPADAAGLQGGRPRWRRGGAATSSSPW